MGRRRACRSTETTRVSVADVGALPPDLAVTNIQTATDRVVATVRNGGDRSAEARVHMTADGHPSGDATATVGPRSAVEVPLAFSGRPSAVTVTVEDRDGLQANNSRYAVVGADNRPAVLLVTGNGDVQRDAFYLRAALAAGAPEQPGYDVQAIAAGKLGELAGPKLSTYAAVVIVSTGGLERRGRELLAAYLNGGGGLLVAAGPEVDGEVASDLLSDLKVKVLAESRPAARTLAAADRRHPVFARFGGDLPTLALVQFRLVARVVAEGCQTIARFTSGEAALVDCPAGEGRAVIVASDLNNVWNDFPLHPTFVPFVQEIVRYAAGSRAHTAEYTVADAPAAAGGRPGIVSLADAGGRGRRVAVNVDPRESDPSRMSASDFEAAVTRLKEEGGAQSRVEARQQEERQRLWRYAIMLVLAALVAEGVIAARTA